ncbi:hypothetical protein LGN09_20400 [Burkholderia cenocepacia]|uniref:hypothetical protein n=1 Tax=Burkholderia cenocepacia TaxID=95486 RepID=UPI001CF55B8B|nr:hypothetical protein [Burkholderia cenocepacia]MCA8407269.1 hypothetical protein [Burkholderia cenocepacia]
MKQNDQTRDQRKVYFYHLKKCGGTSLNDWLDLQVPDSAVWRPDWSGEVYRYVSGECDVTEMNSAHEQHRALATSAFYWSDIVHSHVPMRQFVPAGALSFTILRNPVNRLLSQISDWRRLGPADFSNLAAPYRECIEDAHRMRVKPFLEKHGLRFGRHLLDNYLVRALAASRIGLLATKIERIGDMLPLALEAIEQDFDIIGLTERDEDTRRIICARLGWCPAASIPFLNRTDSASRMRDELDEAGGLLAELTQYDARLYARAEKLFDTEHEMVGDYSFDVFEAEAARDATRRLRAHHVDGHVAFSVHEQIVGCGFYGRDAAGTQHCAIWTGPEAVSRLYMPVPVRVELTVYLWIRGYADEPQRDQLQIRIDGQTVAHRFEHRDGYRDRVAIDMVSTREFTCIEIVLDATSTSGEPGQPGYDSRLRGVCFDRYSWSFRGN